jgi:uncharacterized protein YycO
MPAAWVIPTGLRDGDLIFRRGSDLIATAVMVGTGGSRFSHVGMIVVEEGRPTVVHALPGDDGIDGVRRESLAHFLDPRRTKDAAIVRLPELDAPARRRARAYLLSHLGTPFDARFRFSDDRAHYCTELVLKALHAAGRDLLPALVPVTVVTVDEPAYAPDALHGVPGLMPIPLHR